MEVQWNLSLIILRLIVRERFYPEILFWGGNMVDNFKDSKKGYNTPVGAFATSQFSF